MGKVDPKLLEMADVFHIPKAARLKYIILPAKAPALSRLLEGKKGAKAEQAAAGHTEGGKQ